MGARKSEDLDSLIDADDLAQEIMDLHCVVCKYDLIAKRKIVKYNFLFYFFL